MNLSGGKGPNVHTEFKEKPNFVCRRFKNLKGRKSASAPLSFSGHKWGKNTAGVGRENSLSCSPQHFKSQKALSKLCTTTVRRNVSFFDWNGIFFFPFFLPLYYRSADGLFPHCDKRAQSRAQGDTRAGWRRWRSNQKKTRVSGKEVVSTKKNELISSGCRRMEMSRKAEYLINKMLKYWGFGSVWPVCALCVQAIYICVCVWLRLYVCILNMLLLSPAGRTQHCTLPSLVSWFVFGFFFLLRREKKVNIIKNRCGWNRANSFSSVMNYVVHGFLPANNIKWVVNDNSA